jgi:hypothetical protein
MTDERDAIEPQDDAPVTVERRIRLGSDAPKLITAAAIGAAVGAAVTHIMESSDLFEDIFGRSGDEAPIRVKGGSITFELLSKTAKWKQVGTNKDHWILTEGERGRDEYVAVLVIEDSSGTLGSHTVCGAGRIQLHYGTHAVVELKSNGRKTHLKSTDPADSYTSDPPVLTYLRDVSRIVVGKSSFDLPAGSKLESMLLLDC